MIYALCKRLASNTISINHIFTYDSASPGILETQRMHHFPSNKQWLIKWRKKQSDWTEFDHERRRMLVKESELETIAKSGNRAIKQVEMYTK